MAWDVHLSVVMPCDENEAVAAVAKRHLENPAGEGRSREAAWYLGDLAGRVGKNNGPKGGVSLWGIVGNHTDMEKFIETVTPLFRELLESPVDGGPSDHEHILVFYEPEQREQAGAYEFFRDDWGKGLFVVKHHPDLPFSFGQM